MVAHTRADAATHPPSWTAIKKVLDFWDGSTDCPLVPEFYPILSRGEWPRESAKDESTYLVPTDYSTDTVVPKRVYLVLVSLSFRPIGNPFWNFPSLPRHSIACLPEIPATFFPRLTPHCS